MKYSSRSSCSFFTAQRESSHTRIFSARKRPWRASMKYTVNVILSAAFFATAASDRSFSVDYGNNVFKKDGEAFQFVSGSFHYFRVPKAYWKDRMTKMKTAGLNTLQTYIEWSGHEPEQSQYYFEEFYDIVSFLRMAQELGLLVILRPGPYISAERDNGGLPYWLLRVKRGMQYRSSDSEFLTAVDRWYNKLLPMIKPFLYENGGPIILVQVENEYGVYRLCDKGYMNHLVDTFQRYLGKNAVLYRQDSPDERHYKCDEVKDTLISGSFRVDSNPDKQLRIMKDAQPHGGPLMVTEYYPGWWSQWGRNYTDFNPQEMTNLFERMYRNNASVNFYMFVGGTNFGFSNGNVPPPISTLYDHGAPISAAGDLLPVYSMLKDTIVKVLKLSPRETPGNASRVRIGVVRLPESISLDYVMDSFRGRGVLKTATSDQPMTFEEFGHGFGYVLYTTTITFEPNRDTSTLTIKGLRDNAYVLTRNMSYNMSKDDGVHGIAIDVQRRGDTLKIYVENQGRIHRGRENHDPKGILSEVTLDDRVLNKWTMEGVPLSINDISEIQQLSKGQKHYQSPGFYHGTFQIPPGNEPSEIFADPCVWVKGVIFVNGFNIGRYWDKGPQRTLYIPGSILKAYPGENHLTLLELEQARESDAHIILEDRALGFTKTITGI